MPAMTSVAPTYDLGAGAGWPALLHGTPARGGEVVTSHDPRTFYNREVDPREISRFPFTAAVSRQRFSVFAGRVSGLSCNVAMPYNDRQDRRRREGGGARPSTLY